MGYMEEIEGLQKARGVSNEQMVMGLSRVGGNVGSVLWCGGESQK
jgi:hypothetical protein